MFCYGFQKLSCWVVLSMCLLSSKKEYQFFTRLWLFEQRKSARTCVSEALHHFPQLFDVCVDKGLPPLPVKVFLVLVVDDGITQYDGRGRTLLHSSRPSPRIFTCCCGAGGQSWIANGWLLGQSNLEWSWPNSCSVKLSMIQLLAIVVSSAKQTVVCFGQQLGFLKWRLCIYFNDDW